VKNTSNIDFRSENRRPVASSFHFNYYQTSGSLKGAPSEPNANREMDLTAPTVNHGNIDNNITVINDLTSSIESRINP